MRRGAARETALHRNDAEGVARPSRRRDFDGVNRRPHCCTRDRLMCTTRSRVICTTHRRLGVYHLASVAAC